MTRFVGKLQIATLSSLIASGVFWASSTVRAEIALNDPEKTDGWQVTTSGQVNAYLNWISGETINTSNLGNLVNTSDPNATDRYTLVGPQIAIQGNPTPSGAVASPVNDRDLNTMRIRGGFVGTVLAFNVYKQITPTLKMTLKFGIWAAIQNGLNGGVRQFGDVPIIDFRDQYVRLDGSFGSVWGGRLLGLYNRGGTKMDFFLIHNSGVGHPCNVDSSTTATCGFTGVGSMFPNRNAQIGYATPDWGGFQLSAAIFDPATIDNQWNRTPLPRVESEATFQRKFAGTDEINVWLNGLSQIIGRTTEVAPNPLTGEAGIAADLTRNVVGVGGGAWGRFSGFALGASAWAGNGLGTATAFGNTAIDDHGTLRAHFGYLAITNLRLGPLELAAGYGSANAKETDWDRDPANPRHLSVIKQVRGIATKVAYHVGPVTFSVDTMNLRYEWHRGEVQNANVVSGGLQGEF